MSNHRWSLDPLFKGLDDPKFQSDAKQLSASLNELNAMAEKLDGPESTKRLLFATERFSILVGNLLAYLNLRLTADTQDDEAQTQLQQFMYELTAFTSVEVKTSLAVSQYFDQLIEDPELESLRFYLENTKAKASHLLDETQETLIAELNLSGGDAWETLFDQLTANLEIEFQGETLNLSAIRNLANHADSETRKAAYEAELAAYPRIATPLAFALNSIKRQMKLLAHKRGFASPLDEALFHSSMSRPTLEALLSAMVDKMDIFRRYLRAKARYLGHEGALPWWDLFAPVGNSEQHYTVEEAMNLLAETFMPLHPPIAKMMERSYSEKWTDYLPRKGKVGGAFCSNQPQLGQSFILSNFNGSLDAISTLAHELGHAYHGECIQSHPSPFNWEYSMPVAETASTFNEAHLAFHLLNHSKDVNAKLLCLEGILQGTCQTVVDIYSRFRFEQMSFDCCDTGRQNEKDYCQLMHQAQLEAYGDAIQEESLHPYMWACKGHYYSTHLSFYNFPYAFGSLLSMGLYSRYLKEGASFMERYDAFLNRTTVSTVEGAGDFVGINLRTKEFWLESLATFEQLIDEFEKLVDEARA